MSKCEKCDDYKDFGSEYCWFHGIKVIELTKGQKFGNYFKKNKLRLVSDLLLIVFEYVDYGIRYKKNRVL